MEYVEFDKWKKMKKEKNYRWACVNLMKEMATNLIRVHNCYSDVKYDEEKDTGIIFGYDFFAKNSNEDTIEEMLLFVYIRYDLNLLYIGYCDILEDSIWGTFKEILKDAEKLRRKLIKEIKKLNKV